jgi:hypothetical protein
VAEVRAGGVGGYAVAYNSRRQPLRASSAARSARRLEQDLVSRGLATTTGAAHKGQNPGLLARERSPRHKPCDLVRLRDFPALGSQASTAQQAERTAARRRKRSSQLAWARSLGRPRHRIRPGPPLALPTFFRAASQRILGVVPSRPPAHYFQRALGAAPGPSCSLFVAWGFEFCRTRLWALGQQAASFC